MSDQAKTIFVYGAATVASFFAPEFSPIFFAAAGVASAVINQPDDVVGSRLGDTDYSGSSYGMPIMRGWGTFPAEPVYIWAPPLREQEDTEGGKGGPEITTFSYHASFGVLLAEGPITAVRRVWFDTKLVYDASDDSTGAFKHHDLNISIYLGTGTQTADPLIESFEGVGNVQPWRGYCYIVVNDFPLKDHGNRRPNIRAELVKDTTATDTNRVLSDITGNSNPRISPVDGSIVTLRNDRIQRWDQNTGELLSDVPSGSMGQTDVFVVDDSGWAHGWRYTDVTPYNYWVPRMVNIHTGQIIEHGCITGNTDIRCDPVNYNANCRGNNFGAIVDISIINGVVTYTTGVGSADSTINNMWECADNWIYDTSAVDSNFIISDSDNNVWRCFGITDIIDVSVDGAVPLSFNVFTLFGIDNPTIMQWHVPTQSMLVSANAGVYRLSFNGTTLTKEAGPSEGILTSRWNREYIYDDFIWTKGSVTTFYKIRVFDLITLRTLTNIPGWQAGQWTGNPVFVSSSNSIFGMGHIAGTSFNQLLLDRVPPNSQQLPVVVSDIAKDLDATKKDVSDLSDTVDGFPITRSEQSRGSLGRLFITHYFSSVESEGKLKFLHIPRSVAVNIPESDLSAHTYGETTPDQIQILRDKETQFPREVVVSVLSFKREYEVLTQNAIKQNTPSNRISKVQIMEVLKPNPSKKLAEYLLHSTRDERNLHEFSLGYKYLYLDPLDEVILNKGNLSFRVRILQMDWSVPGILQCRGVSTDPASYDSDAIGSDPDFNGTTINGIKLSQPWLLDAPLLSDQEDLHTPGYYSGASNDSSSGIPGATLLRAPDPASLNATEQATIINEVTVGVTTTILGGNVVDPNVWDNVNTLTINMLEGSLSSSTDTDVLNGANPVFVGGEVIQFVNAIDNGDGTFTISRLLRGVRGTEWAIDLHVNQEEFIFLTTPSIYNVYTTLTTHGIDFTYRAVTFGLSLFESIPKQFTNTNVRLKPFAGVDAIVTESTGDLIFNWTPRSRDFPDPQFISTSIGELVEAYELDILDSNGDVVRTIPVTSPTATYTQVQFLADFGAGGISGFDFKIYQIGALGRGYPLEASTTGLGLLLPVWTDFDESSPGSNVPFWTDRSKPGKGTFTLEDATSSPAATSTVGRIDHTIIDKLLYTFDKAVPALDGEILVKFYWEPDTPDRHHGPCLRVTGSEYITEDSDLLTAWIDSAGDCKVAHYYYEKYPFGDMTPGIVKNLSLTSGDAVWIRFRAIGTNLKVQYSKTDINGVTPSWDYDFVSTAKVSSGYFGLWDIPWNSVNWDFDKFAVAYNGNTAIFS